MATIFKASHPLLFLCFILFSASHFNCHEFEVGGKEGWILPKSKDNDEVYNQWASQNRFKIGDTVRFKYQKDSVLEVTEEEYEKCSPSRPLFFSNNGDTVFTFDRPGMFYFISGVNGHCSRGQKMIIKVLDIEELPVPVAPSPQIINANANANDAPAPAPAPHSKASQITPITTSTLFVLSLFGMLYA